MLYSPLFTRYRNPPRHLNNGEYSIYTLEVAGGQRHTNNRYSSPTSENSRQVRCHPCSSDNDLYPPLAHFLSVLPGFLRGAVSRYYRHLVLNAKLLQNLQSRLHQVCIRFTAHDYTD